jgi:hypothetical protein
MTIIFHNGVAVEFNSSDLEATVAFYRSIEEEEDTMLTIV